MDNSAPDHPEDDGASAPFALEDKDCIAPEEDASDDEFELYVPRVSATALH